MDSPEYLTGVEVCRQEEAERAAEAGVPAPRPWLALSMQPWGGQSAALGLAEDYLGHLARSAEPPRDAMEAAQMAYVTEQFVKRYFVEGARSVDERPGGTLTRRDLADLAKGGRCTYVAFSNPQPSPWPGHPFVGGYLDPDLGLTEPGEPGTGILLATTVPDPSSGVGFWPLYQALNRTVAVWGERGETAASLAAGLASGTGTGPAARPETARAVARLLKSLASPR